MSSLRLEEVKLKQVCELQARSRSRASVRAVIERSRTAATGRSTAMSTPPTNTTTAESRDATRPTPIPRRSASTSRSQSSSVCSPIMRVGFCSVLGFDARAHVDLCQLIFAGAREAERAGPGPRVSAARRSATLFLRPHSILTPSPSLLRLRSRTSRHTLRLDKPTGVVDLHAIPVPSAAAPGPTQTRVLLSFLSLRPHFSHPLQ